MVPFGEFLPLENILGIIGLKSLTNNYQSFSSGSLRELIEIKQKKFSLKILPLICYEIIYSGKLFDKQDFDVIINISEDGWFGKSVGPIQHFNHSIFRAIESGKYILRSANNGIAAIINPVGVIEQKVSFGQSGYVDFKQIKKINQQYFQNMEIKFWIINFIVYFFNFSFNKIKNE